MNLVEHYIEKVFSETDVTKEFKKRNGYAPHERIYLIDMDKKNGYYMS